MLFLNTLQFISFFLCKGSPSFLILHYRARVVLCVMSSPAPLSRRFVLCLLLLSIMNSTRSTWFWYGSFKWRSLKIRERKGIKEQFFFIFCNSLRTNCNSISTLSATLLWITLICHAALFMYRLQRAPAWSFDYIDLSFCKCFIVWILSNIIIWYGLAWVQGFLKVPP